MFLAFFEALRRYKVPVSVREWLDFLNLIKHALDEQVVTGQVPTIEEFYGMAKLCLVKDERHMDAFDQVFAQYFQGGVAPIGLDPSVPADWLIQRLRRHLSPEELANIQGLDPDELMKRLQELLNEQKERHEGGSKWIGTGGISPFGHGGFNPQGHRIGNQKSTGNRTAIKVWEKRAFKDYASDSQLGVRTIQMALRRLRQFARTGEATELDLTQTIHSTAANAGYLDLKMMPPRHNHVKVIVLMDVGGSMDDYVQEVERLFSAIRNEFRHLSFYYFHNCIYDHVWKHNGRRFDERINTYDLMHTYGRDYKLILVGDATMAPYEVLHPHGCVEYDNTESGAVWLERLLNHFSRSVWLNPQPQGVWQYTQTIDILKQIMTDRMMPLTLEGLDQAVQLLNKPS